MSVSNFYMVDLVSSFLSACNIEHNKNMLKAQLEFEKKKSPIITISNILKDYDMQSSTYYADFDILLREKKQALVHFRIGDGRFVVLKNISADESVTFYDPVINKNVKVSKMAFLKLWSKIVIFSNEGVMPTTSNNKKCEKVRI